MAATTLPPSTEAEQDDRPIALRRPKRRASSSMLVSSSPEKVSSSRKSIGNDNSHDSSNDHDQVSLQSHRRRHDYAASTYRTPTKPKKRVRFSDPGPETQEVSADAADESTSTGITPFIARTRLSPPVASMASPPPRYLARPPRRRASLPDLVSSSRSSSSSSAASTASLESENYALGDSVTSPTDVDGVVIQFAPLKQLLSERVKRRLRRSHLSEEFNAIEADRKRPSTSEEDHDLEVQRLRQELDAARRESGIVVGGTGAAASGDDRIEVADRVRELEEEIITLKQEASERSARVDMELGDATSLDTDYDSVQLIGTESACESGSVSVVREEGDSQPQTPTTPNSAYISASASTSASASDLINPTCAAAETQTILESSALTTLYHHLDTQASDLARARLDLERLLPGETALGLASPTKSTSSQALFTNSEIDTTSSHTDQAAFNTDQAFPTPKPLLNALLTHLRTLKSHLHSTNTSLHSVRSQHGALLTQFNTSLSTISALRAQNDHFAHEIKLSERSRAALTAALERYRSEAVDLERLVSELEKGRVEDAEGWEQAVSDLEAEVSAEQRGRREAEGEIDSVRSVLTAEREGREREVGSLNSRVGVLSQELSATRAELEGARGEVVRLLLVVGQEREAGRRVWEGLRGWVGDVGEKVEEWEQGVRERERGEKRNGGVGAADDDGDILMKDCSPNATITALSIPPSSGAGTGIATLHSSTSPGLHSPSLLTPSLSSTGIGKWGLLTPTVEGGRFRDVGFGNTSVTSNTATDLPSISIATSAANATTATMASLSSSPSSANVHSDGGSESCEGRVQISRGRGWGKGEAHTQASAHILGQGIAKGGRSARGARRSDRVSKGGRRVDSGIGILMEDDEEYEDEIVAC